VNRTVTKKEATIVIEKADIATALGMWESVNQKEYIQAKIVLSKQNQKSAIIGDADEIANIRSLKGEARLKAVFEARKRLGLPKARRDDHRKVSNQQS
jgi:hypothetical protein